MLHVLEPSRIIPTRFAIDQTWYPKHRKQRDNDCKKLRQYVILHRVACSSFPNKRERTSAVSVRALEYRRTVRVTA